MRVIWKTGHDYLEYFQEMLLFASQIDEQYIAMGYQQIFSSYFNYGGLKYYIYYYIN